MPAEAKWYSDPTRRYDLRYFDGAAWSNYVSRAGVMAIDPFEPSAPTPPPAAPPPVVAPAPAAAPAPVAAPAPPAAPHMVGTAPLVRAKSREEGRNSDVFVYADRIERIKEKSFGSLSRARQDSEVIPMRAISSVATKKDGFIHTKVVVYCSGNTIEFRVSHADAKAMQDVITQLLLAR